MVGLTNFRPPITVCIVNVMISINKYLSKVSESVFMNCCRSPPCWALIFCKTFKFLCNMWCVMCDEWCVMFRTWFVVRYWLYELRRDQKPPIQVISDHFNDIPKLIPGGSHMYTISCKASYIEKSCCMTMSAHFCIRNFKLVENLIAKNIFFFLHYAKQFKVFEGGP